MNHRRRGRRAAIFRVLSFVVAFGLLIPFDSSPPAEAKTPGHTYCFLGVCHRVKSITETERAIGANVVLTASHYDDPKKDRFNPSRITSSGELLRADRADNAASPIYPDGTKLLVWNPRSKQAAVIRINNAGPYYGSRLLDLSRGAAEKLGFGRQGVATVHARVIAAPTRAEAAYRRGRTYAPVPGPIGSFDSIDTALLDVGRAINNLFASPVYAIAGREPPAPATTARTAVAARQDRQQQPRTIAKGPERAPVVAGARQEPTAVESAAAVVAEAGQQPTSAEAAAPVVVAQAEPVTPETRRTVVAQARPAAVSRPNPRVAAARERAAHDATPSRAQRPRDTEVAVAQPRPQQTRTAAVASRAHANGAVRERETEAAPRKTRVAQEQTRSHRRSGEDAPASWANSDTYQMRLDRGA
jgi:rare lipoprotein A